MQPCPLCALWLCGIALACSAGQSPHPWRPPFGLERVGSSPGGTGFEAEAEARPDRVVNPVDLGAILVPHGWLLLGPQQASEVEVVALARATDIQRATVSAWFESSPADDAKLERTWRETFAAA